MDALVGTGLAQAGYVYANIDDCWQKTRTADGTIVPDPNTFPSGMASLAKYAHSKGLKFGLYSDAGYKTCAERPGSYGFEINDADAYASWGVDYLKYDNCNHPDEAMKQRYETMTGALNQTGRPIFFSMCSWGLENVDTWGNQTGNSWRATDDINDTWVSMLWNWDHNGPAESAGPGGWNDPDMLEVGNGGMTETEYKTHFSLWCIGKAPLIIGCDITQMTQSTKNILMNEEAIAVNQDKLGVQCSKKMSSNNDNYNAYVSPLENKEYAVVLLNRLEQSGKIEVMWTELGLPKREKYLVRDLWQHKNVGTFEAGYSATVEGHGVVFLKLSPVMS
eukprot:490955_1